jgi:hypothetical protein
MQAGGSGGLADEPVAEIVQGGDSLICLPIRHLFDFSIRYNFGIFEERELR